MRYDAKTNSSDSMDNSTFLESTVSPLVVALTNTTVADDMAENGAAAEIKYSDEPNTALMSAILMFGTFFLAYFLRIFRNSQFFGRNVRNLWIIPFSKYKF